MTAPLPADRSLRLSPVDLIVGLLTLAAPFFLFQLGLDFPADRLMQQLWNLGHVCGYFVWTWYLTYRWKRLMAMHPGGRLLVVAALACGTGLVIEGLQAASGKSADGWDIARNLLGSGLALWWTSPNAQSLSPMVLRGGRLLSLGLLLIAVYPASITLVDRVLARWQFPVLADFETPFEGQRWSGGARYKRSTDVALSGRWSLKVVLGTTTYSGVALHIFPRDWRDYTSLEIGVYNPDPMPLQLTCRIHDLHHVQGLQRYQDRFNRRFTIETGWNVITIPLRDVQNAPDGRSMALNRVMAVGLFAARLDRPRVVYLDGVRLRDRR